MSDMKRLLEAVDKAQFAGEKVGQKPGDQWRGSDKKTPGKKLVGEENVFKELDSHLKENAVERKLKTQLAEFKQGVAEGTLNEYRDQLWAWIQSKFPSTQWPEYVQRDFLYAKAKGLQSQKDLEDFLDEIQRDFGRVRWRLEKLPITLDVFTAKTQGMIKQREGGSSNPYQVPKDAERHALQQRMIQQKGVSAEPIIVAKLSNGYDLIEGWHRTIQHLKEFPQGYTAPAWVGYGATYTSESVEQGVSEGSLDDIEDTRQFRNAIALAKSQKAIRHAKYGKDTKFYADGTPVTPEETARRAAERKARKQGVAEATEYGIPDSTPGHLPGGPKMTFGEFKKMWPGVILKRPSGGSLAGSVVADVEGWMNNPKSVWEPLEGVAENNMPPPQQSSTQDTSQQAKVRAALEKGLQISDKNDADEVSRKTAQNDKRVQRLGSIAGASPEPVRREGGWDSRGIRAIASIEPDGTIVLARSPNYHDLASLKQLLAWGGMAGAKLITSQAFKQQQGVTEGEKIGGKYDPEEFDAMVSRLGQKAKQGPMKTVWDPVKRVYKNVPVNQNKQAVKEYGNAQDPDDQSTTPGAAGSAQQDQEDDMGAKLGAQATNQSINALKAIEPNLNPTLAKQALAKGDIPTTMSSAETGQAKELSDLLGTALGNPQTSSQVTALLRKAAQLKGK